MMSFYELAIYIAIYIAIGQSFNATYESARPPLISGNVATILLVITQAHARLSQGYMLSMHVINKTLHALMMYIYSYIATYSFIFSDNYVDGYMHGSIICTYI